MIIDNNKYNNPSLEFTYLFHIKHIKHNIKKNYCTIDLFD